MAMIVLFPKKWNFFVQVFCILHLLHLLSWSIMKCLASKQRLSITDTQKEIPGNVKEKNV